MVSLPYWAKFRRDRRNPHEATFGHRSHSPPTSTTTRLRSEFQSSKCWPLLPVHSSSLGSETRFRPPQRQPRQEGQLITLANFRIAQDGSVHHVSLAFFARQAPAVSFSCTATSITFEHLGSIPLRSSACAQRSETLGPQSRLQFKFASLLTVSVVVQTSTVVVAIAIVVSLRCYGGSRSGFRRKVKWPQQFEYCRTEVLLRKHSNVTPPYDCQSHTATE